MTRSPGAQLKLTIILVNLTLIWKIEKWTLHRFSNAASVQQLWLCNTSQLPPSWGLPSVWDHTGSVDTSNRSSRARTHLYKPPAPHLFHSLCWSFVEHQKAPQYSDFLVRLCDWSAINQQSESASLCNEWATISMKTVRHNLGCQCRKGCSGDRTYSNSWRTTLLLLAYSIYNKPKLLITFKSCFPLVCAGGGVCSCPCSVLGHEA